VRVFLETGLVQPIAHQGGGTAALALAPGDVLYGVDPDTDQLLTIDAVTGVATMVGSLGVDVSAPSLTANAAGELLLASSAGFHAVDPQTGAATRRGDDPGVRGLAATCTDLLGLRPGNPSELVRIDPATGAVTGLGPLAGVIGAGSLGVDDEGTVWSVTEAGPVYTIDPVAVTATRRASTAPLTGVGASAIAAPAVSPAIVGAAQRIPVFGTTAPLGATPPTAGTGTWSVVSGGNGTFAPGANAADATLTHTSGAGPLVLRWTVAGGSCPSRTAELTVELDAEQLATTKARIKLNFARSGRDRITWRGTLPIPDGFSAAGQTVTVDVGGVQRTFTLNGKGRGRSGRDRFALRVKRRGGTVDAQEASYSLSLRGDFSEQLADENLTGDTSIADPGETRTVTGIVRLGDTGRLAVQTFLYTARARRSGNAKG
jgi:hypothetical protein